MKIFLNERMLLSGHEWTAANTEELSSNITILLEALNSLHYNREANVYYSANGMQHLISNFEMLDSLNDYVLTNPIEQLRYILLDIDAINWKESQIQKDGVNYFYQLSGGAITHNVNDTSMAEAAEHNFCGSITALLNLFSSEYNNATPAHINRSKVHPPSMNLITVETLISKLDLTSLIKIKRSPRIFNLNPKHGERGAGKKANKGEIVSPLECDKVEAQSILNDAVGIKGSNELYGYDSVRNKFIVFKSEGNNIYHGYHPINQNEVPENVKKFLLQNITLS